MREQVKDLWKLCFPDDSDDFVELYFRTRYSDEINSAIIESGRVVSALQRVPYPMRFMESVIPVAYISGACTHPDFRSAGLMSRLLDEAHLKMYADGNYMSVLIPANEGLIGYYSRFDYVVSSQQKEKLLTGMCENVDNFKCDLAFSELRRSNYELEEVCTFINQQLSTYTVSILHPVDDMEIVLSDLYLSGGEVWCASDADGKLCGVVLLINSDGSVIVKELLSVDKQSEAAIIRFVSLHYGVSRVEHLSPCGMARVINAYEMLKQISGKIEGEYLLEVYGDNVIPENNGLYHISGGSCRKMVQKKYFSDSVYQKIHICDMPSWLFRNLEPHISLMLD